MENKNLNLQILDINSSGSGTAKLDGYVCFVPYTIDGENVLASVCNKQKNYCTACLQKILTSSPHRTKPFCKYFGKCGGCDFQHMDYKKQLQTKTDITKSLFQKANLQCQHFFPTVPCENIFYYRNKINFNIVNNKLCFFDNSNTPFAVDSCPLFCDKNLDKIIFSVNNFLQNTPHSFKALHIRALENQYNFCFVSNTKCNCDFGDLVENLKHIFQNFSICTSVNPNPQSSNISNKINTIFGNPNIKISDALQFEIAPQSFLQTNQIVQNKIYNTVTQKILPDQTVINAYGGAGFLSANLAQKCKFVYSVEISASATNDCKKLFKTNNITNATAICGDCKDIIPNLAKQNIDTIVFDPARAGIDPKILETLTNCSIKNIIYLSCNPKTLIRDLLLLQNYKITSVTPFDMFPQTKHIEVLVTLQK